MASILWEAFQGVAEAGYLIDPVDTGLGTDSANTSCLPSASGFGSVITTMGDDFGYNDGPYAHASELNLTNWVFPNQIFNHSMLDYSQFHFAEILSHADQPYNAFILIMDPADRAFAKASGKTFGYFNYMPNNYASGSSGFGDSWLEIDIVGQGTPECLSRGVRFGDINGDGLDDFICINAVSLQVP